ncbi:protein-L-isoaspartate(D-aspartate) O-methyltransferase [Labrenzia sp. EL_208]|nr:protein-L-isoaspartate(D-aspartate) O-methyltransferase [Labrenzia sp. EL_132]MBG6231350.1 protein-L-isoaspartate(D-aspartate) O-methyltransferase [Labrenzia sp. EL_208]
MDRFAENREIMVLRQLEGRGIRDGRILAAMRKVPRHRFVSQRLQDHAYRDMPLAIGHCQTISQPYVVALMCELLQLSETDTALEIGTGSGYAAVVLSQLCEKVVTVERIPELANKARSTLVEAEVPNVEVHCCDGSLGFPDQAPYDAILVSAGAPTTPDSLMQQLKPGGRLVIPVGTTQSRQDLLRIRRTSETSFETENLGGVAFVPLIGEMGWAN